MKAQNEKRLISIKFGVLIICLLLMACGANRNVLNSKTKFIKYKNPNTIGVNLDGIEIEDKYFEIFLPEGAKYLTTGWSPFLFGQLINYGDDKKIIIINHPSYKYSISKPFKSPDNSYEHFIGLCTKAEIKLELDSINLKHDKRFAFYKILKDGFYILCLNLEKEEVEAFNYSVGTIKFPRKRPFNKTR